MESYENEDENTNKTAATDKESSLASSGFVNEAFQADETESKQAKRDVAVSALCQKCHIEKALPSPILNNDVPYTIEVYDCGAEHKIEVLRINIADQKFGIEMGNVVKKACENIAKSNQVEPSSEVVDKLHSSAKTVRYEDTILEDKPSSTNEIEALEDAGEERQQWSNPIEFLLSCIAISVGLGNVWRFPFTAYENGGGAFLIPYILVLLFIGRPLYFLELAMGQFSSRSSVKIWDMSPFFRGVGYGQAVATSSVVTYYTCLIAMSVYYLVASMQSVLPWTVCDPSIVLNNTVCIGSGLNATQVLLNGSYPAGTQVIGSAEQYFVHSVLKEKANIIDGIGLPDLKLTACLAFCYLTLFFTLWKGVASSGKVAYFTAIFPYLVLFTLLGRGVTLPGAMKGIMFYITPQWSELLNIKVWYAAVTQSFFSLSVGFGALFTYSSYNGFRHNVYRDTLIISFTDTFTSILAGFTIFSVLGNLSEELNVPVGDVIKSGTGLAFISYPMAIAKFDYVPQLFAVLFFLMLFTLGLGSSTGLISSVIAIIADNRPDWNKTYVAAFVCLAGFLIGLVYITPGGPFILNLVDFYGGGFMIFALTVVEVVAISYVYGMRRVLEDIKFMLGIDLGMYWKFCWGILIPICLTFMFVYFAATFEQITYADIPYPEEAIYAGYILMAFAILQVPIWALYECTRVDKPSIIGKIKGVFKPMRIWGPKNPRVHHEWTQSVVSREINQILQDH